jgi:hypothetical protein
VGQDRPERFPRDPRLYLPSAVCRMSPPPGIARSCPRPLVEVGGIPELEACWGEPAGCSCRRAKPSFFSSWL